MAFPTTTETSTTLASYIPDLWGERLNDFYKLKLMMGDFFVDRSAELADGGNIVYTPNVGEMAANSKTNATAVTLIGGLIIQLKQSILNVCNVRLAI